MLAVLTVIVSKLHRHEVDIKIYTKTFIPGAMLGLGGGLEWASWITLIYLYNNNNYGYDILFLIIG